MKFPAKESSVLYAALESNQQQQALALIEQGEVDLNFQNSLGFTALHLAASRGYEDVVDSLLLKGAQVNRQDNCRMTALHCAAGRGHFRVVQKLLAKGANAHLQDKWGNTALHHISSGNPLVSDDYLAIVDMLLEKSLVIINTPNNNGARSLYFAAWRGRLPIVERVLSRGAEVNAQDNTGNTALHVAAQYGHEEVVTALLANGANPNLSNRKGETAEALAVKSCCFKIVQEIREQSSKLCSHPSNLLMASILPAESSELDSYVQFDSR